MLSLTVLVLGLALAAPTPAFARMHFTTTNERLSALSTRAQSSLALTNPAEIATQLNEILAQAQAAKAAAEEAAQRPASDALDKSVLAKVGTDMDAIVASVNKARAVSGPDQQAALKDIQAKSSESLSAVQARIQAQLAAPAAQPSPSVLPSSGYANVAAVAPGIVGLGAAFLVGGLGLLGVARRRRSA
jgi:hypothetical protein